MGGKSSSSSSQSSQQIDKRIAAQDSAVVLQDLTNNNITVTDAGAVAGIRDVALGGLDLSQATLDNVADFATSIVDLIKADHTASLQAMNQNQSAALNFVDNATQDANARTFDNIAPWLVVGASIIAISYAWRK